MFSARARRVDPEPGLGGQGGLTAAVIAGWIAAAFSHPAHAGERIRPQASAPFPVPGPCAGPPRQSWLPGPVHQLKIGGDPVGRLPAAMPKTISAADRLRRSAYPPDTRGQAGDLLLALAAVECHASAGGPARVPPALLRDLVIVTGRLAGRTWLKSNADRAAAFTALQATWQPPPLAELDHILARLLSDRFSLPWPAHAA